MNYKIMTEIYSKFDLSVPKIQTEIWKECKYSRLTIQKYVTYLLKNKYLKSVKMKSKREHGYIKLDKILV